MSNHLTVHQASDLRVGDAIISIGTTTYSPSRVVVRPLGPITPGSPVLGVHVCTPSILSGNDVLYPAVIDGLVIVVDRP